MDLLQKCPLLSSVKVKCLLLNNNFLSQLPIDLSENDTAKCMTDSTHSSNQWFVICCIASTNIDLLFFSSLRSSVFFLLIWIYAPNFEVCCCSKWISSCTKWTSSCTKWISSCTKWISSSQSRSAKIPPLPPLPTPSHPTSSVLCNWQESSPRFSQRPNFSFPLSILIYLFFFKEEKTMKMNTCVVQISVERLMGRFSLLVIFAKALLKQTLFHFLLRFLNPTNLEILEELPPKFFF